jgi:uncharacterized protein YggT (Ycf19 family)
VTEARPIRSLITVVMNVLIIVAVLVTARIVILFFGALSSQAWAEAIVRVTDFLVIPFGVEAIKTPYGGVFDIDAALMVALLILVEWVLSIARNRS